MNTRRWDFVSAHAETFGVQRIYRILEVPRSGYYRWLAGAKARPERQAAEGALVAQIREVHTAHKGTYGVRCIHAELRGFGHAINRKRVERLMRRHGIEARHQRRHKRTTVPDRLAPPAPDLVQRNFFAAQLDEKWCGDITYVQTSGTWLYLACVIDICSRRVLGWSMATHMRTELVIDALTMAVATRGGHVDGVISTRTGAVSTHRPRSHRSATATGSSGAWAGSAQATTTPSPSRSGKRETMHQRLFTTMHQARLEIFQWLTYYNSRRRHSALDYLSPAEFEQRHHQQER